MGLPEAQITIATIIWGDDTIPSAAEWGEGMGDAAHDDQSGDRSTVDAYLLGLRLRDGVALTIPILAKTLPRLRYMAHRRRGTGPWTCRVAFG